MCEKFLEVVGKPAQVTVGVQQEVRKVKKEGFGFDTGIFGNHRTLRYVVAWLFESKFTSYWNC